MQNFDNVLDEIEGLLAQRKRLSYSGLQQRFGLDDNALNAVRDELTLARQTARDENGKLLVWVDRRAARDNPLDYTPRHLADKILNRRSAIEGERKRVTILFADVKGSQEIADQLGPEAWHELLDRFFALLSEAIHRYEGTVNQYTGDGVMALFGAPIAHEDHALRACLAALEIQQHMRSFGDELRLREGINLSARVGINSGEVIVGRIGDDLRMDYTAQGHSVGLAARMEQICEPGHVYLTRYTARQVEGYVKLRDLGEMEIKGSTEPLRVYDLEGMGQLKTRLDASQQRGLSRFVGRQREMNLLDDALNRTLQGEHQIIGVVANGGVGKSRLCFEFLESARSRGIPVYQGTGVPYAAAVPFYPIKGLVRDAMGITAQDNPMEARRKIAGTLALAGSPDADCVALLADFLGVANPDSPLEVPPEARQRRLFDLIRTVLTDCRDSSACHAVIMIEDMHWIDPGSEAFLMELAQDLKQSPTLVLLNYRPEFASDWLQHSLALEIPLTALGDAELREIADELLGDDASVAAVRDDIVSRAGGNPYFVEEAVRSLHEADHLTGERGAYRVEKPLEKLLIPDSVQALLASRIDRLGELEKQVLQHAAVIGKSFETDALAVLMDVPEAQLESPVEVLEESGFVNTADGEEYDFCHPMMQEVAYKSQLSSARAAIHARLAEHIEADAGDQEAPDERSVLLAHHWERAGEWLRAARWHLKAAVWFMPRDAAATFNAYKKARDLVAQSKQAEEPEGMHLAVAALAGMVRSALLSKVDEAEASEAYVEAREIVERSKDRAGLAELMISNGGRLLNTGDSPSAFQNVQEAMAIAREIGDHELQGRFRIPILLAAFAAGRMQDGLDLLDTPGETPWYEGDVTLLNFGGRAFRALMLAYLGRLEESAREMGACIDFAQGQDRRISWMYANRVEWATLSGDIRLAASDAQTSLECAEEFGAPLFLVVAHRAMARSLLFRNEPGQAIEILEGDRDMIDKGAPAHQFEIAHLVTLAEALAMQGDIVQALQMARAAVQSGETNQSPIWTAQARMVIAANESDAEAAARELDQAAVEIKVSSAQALQPQLEERRAVLARLNGDSQAAEQHAKAALAGYRRIGATGHVRRLSGAG